MTDTDLHPELRPLLFSIAYRMIGSVSEAETSCRRRSCATTARSPPRSRARGPTSRPSPPAWPSTTCVPRACAARSTSGPWLPEPLVTDEGTGDPSTQAELADSLSLAFLVLLERLSPVERAAFIPREVFAYPYDEIAEVIGKSEGSARQLVTRARRHVDAERPRFDVDRRAREELTDRFIEATQSGDTQGLIALLAADVCTYTDGGGKAQAPRRTVHGPEHVARFMVGIARPDRGAAAVTLHPVLINGVPGRLARDAEGNAVAVLTLDVADGLVTAVRIVVNPDKLAHLQAP